MSCKDGFCRNYDQLIEYWADTCTHKHSVEDLSGSIEMILLH